MCDALGSILTTAALAAAGCSGRQLRIDVAAGILIRARRGVYTTRGTCAALQDVAAHGGRAACITAARHLGLWVLSDDARTHVWLRDGQRTYHSRGSCRCVEHWDDGPAGSPAALPSVPRILAQIFRCFDAEELFVVLESALRSGRIDRAGLRWLRQRSNARMREALAHARADADSGLESLLRWRLRRHRLRVRTQRRVASVGVVDALIGDRLLVETDGVAGHGDSPHRHKDLVRDAHAAMWGLFTLRFDYAMFVHDWDLVEAAILGALRALDGLPASR
ncbi:hypothetical protein [Microbacterium telephonicum]|uniref:Very-short-patch-repair endonuclease n=1 Tax=Microbacterium telephonicum TaxID=1714841 RepID=A0A498C4H0_9MICO|nr:hypothetical protein [Microbacterium telephonicum]RLK47431.1 very-short-patch-repair endonuclease [Microbacterium telephonicum]